MKLSPFWRSIWIALQAAGIWAALFAVIIAVLRFGAGIAPDDAVRLMWPVYAALVASTGVIWVAHKTTGAQQTAAILQRERDRRAIAGAFFGEIGGIWHIIIFRKYRETLIEKLKEIDGLTSEDIPAGRLVTMDARMDFQPIFSANSDKVGLLSPDLASELVRLYLFIRSTIETARIAREHVEEATESDTGLISRAWAKAYIETFLADIDEIERLSLGVGEGLEAVRDGKAPGSVPLPEDDPSRKAA